MAILLALMSVVAFAGACGVMTGKQGWVAPVLFVVTLVLVGLTVVEVVGG